MQPSPFGRASSPQSVRGTATTERSRGRARGRGRGRGLGQGAASSASPDASTGFQSNRGNAQRAGLGGAARGARSKCYVLAAAVNAVRDEQEPREEILTVAKVERLEALREAAIFHVRSIHLRPAHHSRYRQEYHLPR